MYSSSETVLAIVAMLRIMSHSARLTTWSIEASRSPTSGEMGTSVVAEGTPPSALSFSLSLWTVALPMLYFRATSEMPWPARRAAIAWPLISSLHTVTSQTRKPRGMRGAVDEKARGSAGLSWGLVRVWRQLRHPDHGALFC